jgi:putative salt-induced outer membrane protein
MNKFFIKPSLILIASLAASGAFAQVKTDGLWRGFGAASLSMASGNTSSSSLLINGEAVKATTADKITLSGAVNRAESKTAAGVSSTTADKWLGNAQYDFNLTPRTFAFGRLGLESDGLIDLSLRSMVVGGLGFKVVNTPEATFEVFGGLGYSTDKYGSSRTIGGKTGTSFDRASIYLAEASSHQLSPTVSFKQRLDLFPGISGDKALLAKFSAGLSVAMSSTLNLTAGLFHNHNSKPAAGAKSGDTGLFTGVNVKFGAN